MTVCSLLVMGASSSQSRHKVGVGAPMALPALVDAAGRLGHFEWHRPRTGCWHAFPVVGNPLVSWPPKVTVCSLLVMGASSSQSRHKVGVGAPMLLLVSFVLPR